MPEDTREHENEPKRGEDPEREGYKNSGSYWHLALKFTELVFAVVCVALLVEPVHDTVLVIKVHFHHVNLVFSTFVSYIIINLTLIIGRFLGEQIGVRSSLIFSILGSGLFFVSSILLFVDSANLDNYIFYPRYYLKNMWVASASFALLNAVVFVIDTVLTFLKRDDF